MKELVLCWLFMLAGTVLYAVLHPANDGSGFVGMFYVAVFIVLYRVFWQKKRVP